MTVCPTFKELRAAAEELSTAAVSGVSGALRISSGRSGPCLGVSVCTHGNEPAGLAVVWWSLFERALAERLRCGEVVFVLNSPQATFDYFSGNKNARFVDVNMNRLDNEMLDVDSEHYEVRRLRELLPLVQQFQVALDIHTTSIPTEPMIVEVSETPRQLYAGLPYARIVSGISEIQVGVPVGYFYGGYGRSIPCFEIEAGQHEAQESFVRAIESFIGLMENLGMIERPAEREEKRAAEPFEEYEIASSIMFPDDSYELVRDFENFGPIARGECLATGSGAPICAPSDGHTLFASASRRPASLAEEALFLTHPRRLVMPV
ncbi:MAG: hypothetical protein KDD44_02090 [Bdellovibrionales bacterium]|nr:hypothetical protein [Bdellovibrionales bacterium]